MAAHCVKESSRGQSSVVMEIWFELTDEAGHCSLHLLHALKTVKK